MNVFHAYAALLPRLLLCIIIATVLLSALQAFQSRKNPDWGIPLIFLGICFAVVAFLWTMDVGIFNFEGSWQETLPVALLVTLICSIPALSFFLVYRAAKKKWARDA